MIDAQRMPMMGPAWIQVLRAYSRLLSSVSIVGGGK